ncbi:GIY-YIG nuclease family protein [Sphaerotilus sp.]|uniref:GIY-YIG nuclease family protein n=1 Tax=Sphaerotilus sp. TaxID=2093942 RepID=UPI002ACD2606|nr:GIY-YIG nuclease family protein [Sphaerotilus sp.]MDZ7855607.1 GIY-YIG nuclease family protein [Sphaerotilus sp.]
MPDTIYLLTNEAMPGLVKIGRTGDTVEARMASLSAASGVPLPFECYFAAEVKDCVKLEKILHQLFADARLNPKREFFSVDPEKVVLAIGIGDFKEITLGYAPLDQEDKAALEKAKARRPRIKLDALGIYPGATLAFSRDENITATVVDGGRVFIQGQTMSLSAAALMVLHSLGYQTTAASGSEYWIYEEELLDDRRKRMEAEQFNAAPSEDT